MIAEENAVSVIEQKRQTWGTMGVAVHQTEMKLQAMAQEAILTITLPKDITEVAEHELILKELKKKQCDIETLRKTLSVKFNSLIERLMQPEKSLTDPINGLQMEIIKIKKGYEETQKGEQKKTDEIKTVKEKILNYMSDVHAKSLTLINSTVSDMYGFALGAGNVNLESLEAYLIKCEGRLSVFDFQKKNVSIKAEFAEQEAINAVIADTYKPKTPVEYVALFHELLREKFADYAVAWQNKAEALKQAEIQAGITKQAIEDQKNNAQMAAKLDSISTELTVQSDVKALKGCYEIDMPETVETVVSIMKAFIMNLELCREKLRVNKWFAFMPLQAGIALGKIKSDNNSFAPAGIIFKKVDKL